MKPAQRLEWIKGWLAEHPSECEISILHQAFSDAYIVATQAPYQPLRYGAFRCPRLSQDLTRLSKAGFQRKRIGLTGAASEGWPKWVWSYPNPHFK